MYSIAQEIYRDAYPLTDVSQAPKTDVPQAAPMAPPAPPPPASTDSMPEPSARSIEPGTLEDETITYLVKDRASFRPVDFSGELMLAMARGEPVEVRVDTYTDTLLAEDDSRAMTALWAAEVVELLVLLDVDPSIITVTAHGEDDLAVETEDGVDEVQNRRVVVTVVYE